MDSRRNNDLFIQPFTQKNLRARKIDRWNKRKERKRHALGKVRGKKNLKLHKRERAKWKKESKVRQKQESKNLERKKEGEEM